MKLMMHNPPHRGEFLKELDFGQKGLQLRARARNCCPFCPKSSKESYVFSQELPRSESNLIDLLYLQGIVPDGAI